MNICVCVKQVPDTGEIKVDAAARKLVMDGVPNIVNPFDTYAQEAGVLLKEKLGGKLVVIAMGPEEAKNAIKTCLSVGADEGYLVLDPCFAESDAMENGRVLAKAIQTVEEKEGLKFDLILCGNQSADGSSAQVGPAVAECLGLPQVTCALDVTEQDGALLVKREYDEGYDVLSPTLPAVVTVAKLPTEPRYPTIKSKMAAKKKAIPVLTLADLPNLDAPDSSTKVLKTYVPVREKNGVTLKGMETADAVNELIRLLDEAKLV